MLELWPSIFPLRVCCLLHGVARSQACSSPHSQSIKVPRKAFSFRFFHRTSARYGIGMRRCRLGRRPAAVALLVAAGAVQQQHHLPRVQGLLPSFPAVPTVRRAVANVLELQASSGKNAWEGSDRSRRRIAPSGLVEVPLIDGRSSSSPPQPRGDNDNNDDASDALHHLLQPLPSAHLPNELSAPHLYGMDLSLPLYRHMIRYASDVASSSSQVPPGTLPLVGHVAHKPNDDTWVGAIGCTAQILTTMPPSLLTKEEDDDGPEDEMTLAISTTSSSNTGTPPCFAVCRGYRRFVVTQVLRTIPYPVALVEELVDNEPGQDHRLRGGETAQEIEHVASDDDDDGDDDDDDDEDPLDALEASELVPLLVRAVNEYMELQLDAHIVESPSSPLEQALWQDFGPPGGGGIAGADPMAASRAAQQSALEAAAVWQTFQSSLIDLAPLPRDRYYAVAMLAAELVDLDAAVRRQCLVETAGAARLLLVLKKVRQAVGLQRARLTAQSITDASDEKDKDLLVGVPSLPPWAKQIQRGTRLEYYWNEEYGWCEGIVADDPILVVDELLVTVHFTADGTTHRLPFTADEKVRWRPAKPTPPSTQS